MSFETLLYEIDSDGLLTLTLNRPDRLNAMTRQMRVELMEAFDLANRDDAVRAVIVTGAGRGFCSGADLSGGSKVFDKGARGEEPARLPDGSVDYSDEVLRDGAGRLVLRIFDSMKPVIGAINGAAVGVGATMLLPMDVRIASDAAKFGFVFARRGVVPEGASTWFLPRLVGVSKAMQWCSGGAVFCADEALAAGLVSEVVAPDALLPAARRIALEMTTHSAPVSVALIRQMTWRMLTADHPMEAHRIESRALYELGRSADAKEGVAAFLEKRPAQFPGKVSSDLPPFMPWWPDRPYS